MTKLSDYVVTDYGAVGDGSADDTAAIQAAINACEEGGGGLVILPAGRFLVRNLLLTSEILLLGSGPLATTLVASDPGIDVVSVQGAGNWLHDLGFAAHVRRSSGAYVHFGPDSSSGGIDHFAMTGAYIGIQLSGQAMLYVEHGSIRASSTAPGGAGILIDGGNDQYLSKITMDHAAAAQPAAGIRIDQTGCCCVSDCDIIHSGNCLLITGGTSIYAQNSFFDQGLCGIRILALKPVQRCHFLGCWTSSHQEHGFLIEPGSPAAISDIDVLGHHSFYNLLDGMHLGQGSHLSIQGSRSRHNRAMGIDIGSATDYVLISGNDTTDNASDGIRAGATRHVIINNNF